MDKISGLKAGNQQLKEVRFMLTMCSQNTFSIISIYQYAIYIRKNI